MTCRYKSVERKGILQGLDRLSRKDLGEMIQVYILCYIICIYSSNISLNQANLLKTFLIFTAFSIIQSNIVSIGV